MSVMRRSGADPAWARSPAAALARTIVRGQEGARKHRHIMRSAACRSGWPALRFANHEIAEHLYPGHGLQLFGINEIGVELNRVRFAEQLNQTVVFLDQIVRQRGNAEALLAGADQAEHVVDLEKRFARAGAV